MFGRLAGLTGRELSARIDETLDMVGLSAHDAHRVSTFSGGMKRRLNLGVALLHRPSLLLLDEPTVGVDPQSRNLIFENLLRLHRLGTTIVYTTHYMEEAERLCERHCIIDRGTILLDANRATLASYLAGHRLLVELAPDIAESVGRDLAARGLTVSAPAPDRLEVHRGEALGRVEEMARLLGPSRGEVRVLESRRLTLEDKFLELGDLARLKRSQCDEISDSDLEPAHRGDESPAPGSPGARSPAGQFQPPSFSCFRSRSRTCSTRSSASNCPS